MQHIHCHFPFNTSRGSQFLKDIIKNIQHHLSYQGYSSKHQVKLSKTKSHHCFDLNRLILEKSTVDWVPNMEKIFIKFYIFFNFLVMVIVGPACMVSSKSWCRAMSSVCCKFIKQLCIISLGQKLIIEFQQEPLSPPRTIQYWAAFISFFKSAHTLLWRKMSMVNCWPLMQKWMGRECNLFNSQYLNV